MLNYIKNKSDAWGKNSFVDESRIMAVYKIPELFMKQNSNFRKKKIHEEFKKNKLKVLVIAL